MTRRDAALGLFLCVGLAFLAVACATEARSPAIPPEPKPWWSDLADLGTTLTWSGGISAAVGIALAVLSFHPKLAILGGLGRFVAIAGVCVTVTGAACSWLAANPVIVLLVAAACVAGMGWWYWPRIRRALDRRLDGKA